ncbi:mannitol dehydrogenase family protein [Isoptericola jiangsuensis]|uniref:mannitol dehydrogenase family protein n=1 Tax=Isoptericola jiangsuensis TaxID=548579 RepID=UPI003AB0AFD3
MTDRLHRSTLPETVEAPVTPESVGIVHLGIGAFHRAHQAVYTEMAARATGDRRWGILGVTQRSASVRDQLRPQDGVYSVLTAGADETSLDLVGAVVDVAWPAEETERVLDAVGAATTHLVTLTVTEKGYCRKGSGSLDLSLVSGDVVALRAEQGVTGGTDVDGELRTGAVGLLVRGLAARFRAAQAAGDHRPLTVLTCDNMVDNGRVLQGLVGELVDAALPGEEGDTLRAWLAEDVTFPCSMVDRIVPATTAEQRDDVEHRLGVRDEGLVVGEPFSQWVIEDRFAGPRPAWERVGATLTDDVAVWERAKLRLLNGTHSLLAYAGRLAGHETIAEAVQDPAIAARARQLLFEDALATLVAPEGADLVAYGESLLVRFANPATGHTTRQVSMDGTQKIPYRWGGTIAERLEVGEVPRGAAFALAAWAEVVRREAVAGRAVDDPRGEEMAKTVAVLGGGSAADARPEDVARALTALAGMLPSGVGLDPALLDAVAAEVEGLL